MHLPRRLLPVAFALTAAASDGDGMGGSVRVDWASDRYVLRVIDGDRRWQWDDSFDRSFTGRLALSVSGGDRDVRGLFEIGLMSGQETGPDLVLTRLGWFAGGAVGAQLGPWVELGAAIDVGIGIGVLDLPPDRGLPERHVGMPIYEGEATARLLFGERPGIRVGLYGGVAGSYGETCDCDGSGEPPAHDVAIKTWGPVFGLLFEHTW